jgi:sugar/nucleoside kinase (ribokinase family)
VRAVPLVDTNGAGDAFLAVWLVVCFGIAARVFRWQ